MKKFFIPIVFSIGLISGISLVFGNFINFESTITLVDRNSTNIIIDNASLNSNIVIFKSNRDISNAHIYSSSCSFISKFLLKKGDEYYFSFHLKNQQCYNTNAYLIQNGEIFKNSHFEIHLGSNAEIFTNIIRYKDSQLVHAQKGILQKIQKYEKYEHIHTTPLENIDLFTQIKNQRKYKELKNKLEILNNIIAHRKEKYSLPVAGYKIGTGLNVIPNADRHYRKSYTDGIHHGWDIMAPAGTVVTAIDKGVIIRVVNNFNYEDIANIKKGKGLTHSDKLRNLDILRGNQVWLKTTKGDVIFYSHLAKIPDTIQEGIIINEGAQVGTIGKTGVPDKNYTNYHLHFPIQKNPHNILNTGKDSFEDIMGWDWYLKGLSSTDVVNGQKNIFKE